jgi:hypothetical protein
MARAIIFNGSNQNAKVTLPNAAPFNDLGAFKFVFKARSFNPNISGRFFIIQDKVSTYVESSASPKRIDFTEHINGAGMFHPPTSYSDVIGKIQFDPSNSRWTYETWKADGTGRVERTVTISSTANLNLGGKQLVFASNEFNVVFGAYTLDWWYMQYGVDEL